MPFGDGTGPFGYGRRTGRGLGPCGLGLGPGMGRGMGRGFGYTVNVPAGTSAMTKEDEQYILGRQLENLEYAKKQIEKRLSELK